MKHRFDWDLTWISLPFNLRTHNLCSTQKRMNEIYKVPHCKSRNYTRKMDVHRHYLKLRNNLHFSPIGLIWLIHVMHEIGDWGVRKSVNKESWVQTGILIMEIIQFHTFTSQHDRGTCERWPVQTVGGKQASSNLSVIWPKVRSVPDWFMVNSAPCQCERQQRSVMMITSDEFSSLRPPTPFISLGQRPLVALQSGL